MKSLRDILKEAEAKHVAIGHFNISDLVTLQAILDAAMSLSSPRKKIPIIIGTSEGEREFIGVENAVALVRTARKKYKWPIFLNADHTHSLEKIKEAVEVGYDAVLFDPFDSAQGKGGKLPLEENIRQTKEVMAYVRSVNPDIVVEGELGYIGSASEVLDKVPEGAAVTEATMTTVEEATRFVKETGVDLLAPAVGNRHGIVVGVPKSLSIGRITAIKKAIGISMVLHGGSGTAAEEFTRAIEAGINIVHVSTELRVAWRKGIEEGLAGGKEVTPYKLLAKAKENIKEVVMRNLKIFSGR